MGAQLVREVADKTSELTGDGTTTATLLAQSLIREGMRVLDDGVNPMQLRRGIEDAVELVVAELARSARVVDDVDDCCATSRRSPRRRTSGSAAPSPRRCDRVGEDGVVSVEECELPGHRRSTSSRGCTSRTATCRRT